MIDYVMSAVILAALALLAGAVVLFRRGNRKRALLIGALVLVMLGNVVIWLLPTASGDTLAGSVEAAE